MRNAVVLTSLLAVLLGACGGGLGGSAATGAASPTEARGEPIVILTRLAVADMAGADIPATGEVLEGSTLAKLPFCVGGGIEDRHAGPDEEPYLLVRTITCPDGTVRIGFSPGGIHGQPQQGTWTIVSGTGAFEGLGGSGAMETTYDPSDDSLARETLTGTVTR